MAVRPAGREDDRLTAEERVVLVDRNDREIGTEEKLRAHESGVLHRAVSVFVFDAHGRILLQRRARRKYHSAGKWSNTCCSHPRPGETPSDAAHRRLGEEMGISSELTPAFSFIYRAELDHGLIEHELDHVFVGTFTGAPAPDVHEVSSWGWMPMATLIADCAAAPADYSAWLPTALEEMVRQRSPEAVALANLA
jgi:isopentenyl-diphosphate delta-isomerase